MPKGRKLDSVHPGDGRAPGAAHLPQAAHLWHRTSYAGLQIIQVVQSRKAPHKKNIIALPCLSVAHPLLYCSWTLDWFLAGSDSAVDSLQRLSKLSTAQQLVKAVDSWKQKLELLQLLKSQNFEAKVWSRFWGLVLLMFLKLNLTQVFEFEVWSESWN